jgi:DNA-binding HxlR family transcriptional regulator
VLGRTYEDQTCSVARSLEVVGERWTMLVLRDAFRGVRRFEDFQRSLGVARNVLTARLGRLVEEGILERRCYCERPVRYEYRLTAKGVELWPVLMHLLQWGDRHYPEEQGVPVLVEHRGCGGSPDEHLLCGACGAALGPRDVVAAPGPALQAR